MFCKHKMDRYALFDESRLGAIERITMTAQAISANGRSG